jgi:hypothetical protein
VGNSHPAAAGIAEGSNPLYDVFDAAAKDGSFLFQKVKAVKLGVVEPHWLYMLQGKYQPISLPLWGMPDPAAGPAAAGIAEGSNPLYDVFDAAAKDGSFLFQKVNQRCLNVVVEPHWLYMLQGKYQPISLPLWGMPDPAAGVMTFKPRRATRGLSSPNSPSRGGRVKSTSSGATLRTLRARVGDL